MRIFICLLLLGVSSGLSSQTRQTDKRIISEEMRYSAEKKFNSWAVTAGYGPIVMYTDITDFSVFPDKKVYFGPSVIVSKQFFPSIALDLQYLSGKMYGEKGPYYFTGDFREGSLSAVFFINQLTASPGPINDRWNLYIKIGAGATFFRSGLHFVSNDEVVKDSDLGGGSERYMVIGYDPYDPYKETKRRMEIMVPMTAGLMYRINKSFDIAWETSLRFCASDNLDNVLTGSTNDRYLFSGLHLSYKIGKKDKRHMRWTYRGYGFNLFGRPKKDPLVNEITQLEDEIKKAKEGRVIKKDSVIIKESLTVLYETEHVRTIFFPDEGHPSFDTEDKVLMAEAVVQMKHHPGAILEIYGHVPADESGDQIENSRKQCNIVVDFLVNELGANDANIKVIPIGSKFPLAVETELSVKIGRIVNRRVDMVVRR